MHGDRSSGRLFAARRGGRHHPQLLRQGGLDLRPSLLVDMEEGRTTEGEHTIGDMVRRAANRGIACPVLTAALCNLQAYEIGRAAIST